MKAGIIGDILGSTFEGYQWKDENLPWTVASRHQGVDKLLKDTPFVRTTPFWTDDTLCTLGLWKAYSQGLPVAETLRDFCLQYGDIATGFGKSFRSWLATGENPHSKGNGCIMRIGFIPHLPLSLENQKRLAEECTRITHDHPESLEAVSRYVELADAIKKRGKDAVLEIEGETVEGYHQQRRFEALALPTLAQAVAILKESDSLESVYRKAFYIGGDCDTLACVAGSLAEFMYPIPTPWITLIHGVFENYPEMQALLQAFEDREA